MKLFSKVAAVLCGAVTLTAAGAALSASAADKPNIYADQIYATPGEVVDFSLNIKNNSGYAGSGIGLYYDERLTPQGVSDLEIEGTLGEASTGLAGSLLCNTKKLRVGWTSSGTKDNATDGAIYTVRFKVPDDAKADDTFPMQVVVTQFCTAKNVDVDYEAVDGWIKIKDVTTTTPETTTTTSSETTTSSTTSETTTSSTTKETTTVSDTTSSSSSQETTSLSSSDETTSLSSSDETTTVSQEPGTDASSDTTSSSSSSQGGDQPGPITGDAGIALAIAGLLTAAGAAVVIRRKH